LFGLLLVAAALVALPSGMVVESYVGGSAVHGHVEEGHYFVNPGHGQPVAEVSGTAWRAAYWLELLWPLSVVLGLIGGFLMLAGKGPNWKPAPAPPKEMPTWVLRLCLASAGVTVGGTWLCWAVVRTPWVVEVVGCLLFYITAGSVGWLYTRSLRPQPIAEPGGASPSGAGRGLVAGVPKRPGLPDTGRQIG
jgi:hypothetical protein